MKRIFGVGAGHDYCHELIEGLPIELLNDRVCHPSKNKRGDCRVVEQNAWINEVAKAICHVSGVSLSIGDDVGIRNSICYITPLLRAQHEVSEARKLSEEERRAVVPEETARRLAEEDRRAVVREEKKKERARKLAEEERRAVVRKEKKEETERKEEAIIQAEWIHVMQKKRCLM